MYFHDLTFGRQLQHDLALHGYSVKWVQAEHKLGRIRIALNLPFEEIDNLISYITMYMHDLGFEWRFKGKEIVEKSVFVDTYILTEFKEMLTIS